MTETIRRLQDIDPNEAALELAIMKFIEGKNYIKAKELAPRLGTTAHVVGAAVRNDDVDWPLEETEFRSKSTTYQIALGDSPS